MEQPQEQRIKVGHLEMRFFVDGTHTDGHLAVAEMIVPVGAKVPPPHSHADVDETIVGIEGLLSYSIDGVTHQITPGARRFSPRGKVHGFANHGATPAHVLLMFSPATIGPAYFRDIAEVLNAGGPPDFSKVTSVMARYGLTLAPPPA